MTIETNIKQFLKKFEANQRVVLQACEKTINNTLQEMYNRIVERTPVGNPALWNWPAPKDYKPGTLKASWVLSFGGVRDKSTGQFKSQAAVTGNYGINLQVRIGKKTASIYNEQPYAQRVETGWSTQAPNGMMRVTIAEYIGLIDKNAARYRIR